MGSQNVVKTAKITLYLLSMVVYHFAPNTLIFRDFTKLLQPDHTADYSANFTAVLY